MRLVQKGVAQNCIEQRLPLLPVKPFMHQGPLPADAKQATTYNELTAAQLPEACSNYAWFPEVLEPKFQYRNSNYGRDTRWRLGFPQPSLYPQTCPLRPEAFCIHRYIQLYNTSLWFYLVYICICIHIYIHIYISHLKNTHIIYIYR